MLLSLNIADHHPRLLVQFKVVGVDLAVSGFCVTAFGLKCSLIKQFKSLNRGRIPFCVLLCHSFEEGAF